MKQQLGVAAALRRLDPRLMDGSLGLLLAVVSLIALLPTAQASRRDPDVWSMP